MTGTPRGPAGRRGRGARARRLEYLHVYVTGTRWRDERGEQGEEPLIDLPFVNSFAKPELMRRLGQEGWGLCGVLPGTAPGNPGGSFTLVFVRPAP